MLHRLRTYCHTVVVGFLATLTGCCRADAQPSPTSDKLNPSVCEEYIQTYHKMAIRQQQRHKIPASIILAQGLLESGAGQSYLALAGNNHFGIKCKDWKGPCIRKDDDLKQEPFRKYVRAEESFEDHSRFLTERDHYKPLFKLKPTDYKAWAHGLKKCGYATDPQYAGKLIGLIEKYKLHSFDTVKETKPQATPKQSKARHANKPAASKAPDTKKKGTPAKASAATKKPATATATKKTVQNATKQTSTSKKQHKL